MRVLVTGIGGFVGPAVAGALVAAGHEVHGLLRTSGEPGRSRLARLRLRPDVLEVGDVRDGRVLESLITRVAPDAVLHLAGVSFVPAAEADPDTAYSTNLGGTLALLGALRTCAPQARLVAVTSSDVYGQVEPGELPLAEETALRPSTVYGASKAAADLAAAQWGRAYGLDVVRARPFNHTGPGQDPGFVCSAIARQIAAIEAGRQPPIVRVGNVDAVRDFSDVGDIARGYVALLERGRRGEAYNLCSGEGTSIAEVIALLRSHARVPVQVHSDAGLRRASEVPRVVGSHARATRDTGWRPHVPLTDTLAAVLDDWRTRIDAGE
jgi:GDP-4-dehydro-6-deoxy-D-mannose reductase